MSSPKSLEAELTAPGSLFEVGARLSGGRRERFWVNAAPNLPAIISKCAGYGEHSAFVEAAGKSVGHKRFAEMAGQLALQLVEDGTSRAGRRIALAVHETLDSAILCIAIALTGATAVLLNPRWKREEIAAARQAAAFDALISSGEHAEDVVDAARSDLAIIDATQILRRAGLSPVDSNQAFEFIRNAESHVATHDAAVIMFTAGSTAAPKGVILSHGALASSVFSTAYSMERNVRLSGLQPQKDGHSVTLLASPIFHISGLLPFLIAADGGARLVLMNRWNPHEAATLIRDNGVTRFSGVPTMIADLLRAERAQRGALSSLRTISSGGAPLSEPLARAARQTLPHAKHSNGYGLTETAGVLASIGAVDQRERPQSVGVPIPVNEIRIACDTGDDPTAGAVGEICVRGPTVSPAYTNPDSAPLVDDEGWFRTGDLGRLDADGYLHLVGRTKDIIIRGGENVSAREIAEVIERHQDVTEVLVFGLPHRRLGEVVAAAVSFQQGSALTPGSLRDWVSQRLSRFKVPEYIWTTPLSLPRLPTGKIDRRSLAAWFQGELSELSDPPLADLSAPLGRDLGDLNHGEVG